MSNATVVRREREARKAARETEVARRKAAAAAATAEEEEEEEELRQAKVRQRACEAKLRQLEECVASQRKTGARQTACATAANVAGKSAQHSATAEDKKAWRQAKDVECREETPLGKCAAVVELLCRGDCRDAGGGLVSVVWPDCGDGGGDTVPELVIVASGKIESSG